LALSIAASIVLVALVYVLSVFFHEAAHFLAFRLQGIKVRAFFFMALALIWEGRRVRLRASGNALGTGGMVLPALPPIEDGVSFARARAAYARALIAAPMASAAFGCLLAAAMLPLAFGPNNAARFPACAVFTSALLVAALINISSLAKTPSAYGDYQAYRAMLRDELFAATQCYNCMFFVEDSDTCRARSGFLKSAIAARLMERLSSGTARIDGYTASAIDGLLTERLVSADLPERPYIDSICERLADAPDMLARNEATEQHGILLAHLAYWLKLRGDSRHAAFREQALALVPDGDVRAYYAAQMAQLLDGQDNRQALGDKRNIHNASNSSTWHLFDGYYADELKLNSIVGIGTAPDTVPATSGSATPPPAA